MLGLAANFHYVDDAFVQRFGRSAARLGALSLWDVFERAVSDGDLTLEQMVRVHKLDGDRLYRTGDGVLHLCTTSATFLNSSTAEPTEIGLRVSDPVNHGYLPVNEDESPEPHEHGEDATIRLGVAAERLGVSVSTVRRWSDRGRVTAVRTEGGHRRIRLADIEREHQRLFPGPTVRTPRDPISALPTVGAVILERTTLLHELTLRSTYAGDDLGWFGTAEGAAELDQWFTELADGLRGGDFESVTAATAVFLVRARSGGADLLERVALLDGACQAVAAVLDSHPLPADELRDWARVDRSLRRRALE